jgi:hypothetical protein
MNGAGHTGGPTYVSRRSHPNRWTRAGALIAGLTVAAVTMTAPSAGAASSGEPAVIGPVLTTMSFGTAFALPLACGASVGVVSSGASSFPGGTAASSPFLAEFSRVCDLLADDGSSFFSQANADVAALDVINPVLNPAIAQISASVQMVGTNYATSLAPFGPYVAGLGGSLSYFEGS